jgi:hypothetical protein
MTRELRRGAVESFVDRSICGACIGPLSIGHFAPIERIDGLESCSSLKRFAHTVQWVSTRGTDRT